MPVLMFQDRFAEMVRTGLKRQTIRPKRKRPICVGDSLSLRKWEGKAYRSKQIELNSGLCLRVADFEMTGGYIKIDGEYLGSPGKYHPFAVNDGFYDITDMSNWFERTHGFPFYGDLIMWMPLDA